MHQWWSSLHNHPIFPSPTKASNVDGNRQIINQKNERKEENANWETTTLHYNGCKRMIDALYNHHRFPEVCVSSQIRRLRHPYFPHSPPPGPLASLHHLRPICISKGLSMGLVLRYRTVPILRRIKKFVWAEISHLNIQVLVRKMEASMALIRRSLEQFFFSKLTMVNITGILNFAKSVIVRRSNLCSRS